MALYIAPGASRQRQAATRPRGIGLTSHYQEPQDAIKWCAQRPRSDPTKPTEARWRPRLLPVDYEIFASNNLRFYLGAPKIYRDGLRICRDGHTFVETDANLIF